MGELVAIPFSFLPTKMHDERRNERSVETRGVAFSDTAALAFGLNIPSIHLHKNQYISIFLE